MNSNITRTKRFAAIFQLSMIAVMSFSLTLCGSDWREGFESYTIGALHGQGQWCGGREGRDDESQTIVVNQGAHGGKQAVAIYKRHENNRVYRITRRFEPVAGTVWVEAYVKAPREWTKAGALTVSGGSKPLTHAGFQEDTRKSIFSTWTRSYWREHRGFSSQEPRWYRLTERIDLARRTWALWVDGKIHTQGLPLLSDAAEVTELRIAGGGCETDPLLVDDLYVGNTAPDGIILPLDLPPKEKDLQFRFALFGDPQLGFGDKTLQRDIIRFRAAISQAVRAGADFVLLVGDLVHHASDETFTAFVGAAKAFTIPWYPIPGNHDPDPLYRKYIRKDFDYTFRHKGFTFIGMKTWAEKHQGRVTAEQLKWLETQLRKAREAGDETVIFCHVTPYGPNPRGWWIREGQEEFLALCKQYSVLAVLAGHFHRELWHWELNGVHYVIAPGLTMSRGELGWVLYDVCPDSVTQYFKPLWNAYEADGTREKYVLHGLLRMSRRTK